MYPGFDMEMIKGAVDLGSKAIVIGCYVCGTFPNYIRDGVEYALQKQVPVFLLSGSREPDENGISFHLRYGTQFWAIDLGAVPLEFPNESSFIEVMGHLEQLVEASKTPEEIIKEMTAKYCSAGFDERLREERKHALTKLKDCC